MLDFARTLIIGPCVRVPCEGSEVECVTTLRHFVQKFLPWGNYTDLLCFLQKHLQSCNGNPNDAIMCEGFGDASSDCSCRRLERGIRPRLLQRVHAMG